MRLAITIALLLLLALEARPATINAATASRADVGTACAASSPGDTVAVPAGAAAWSSKLNITTAITLQFDSATHITNTVSGDYMIEVTLSANATNRITGGNFYAPAPADYFYQMVYVTGADTDNRRFRMDHFTANWMTNGVLKLDTVYGVADHFTLKGNAPGNKLAHIKNSTSKGLTRGNGSWTNATPLFGTENFFFFETFLAESTNTIFIASLIDAQAGARYVVRDFTNRVMYVEGHGSEAQYERSTHAVEVYKGYFWNSNISSIVGFWRGGSGLFFSNSVNDVAGVSTPLALEHNRMNDSLFAPFGGADGRSVWDVNNSGLDTATATSAGTLTVTASAKSWAVNALRGQTIRKTSGKAVTSINRSGSTITVVCTGHGFSSGNLVSLFGANEQPYNTLFNITVSDANTFTASMVGTPTTPATGTIKACVGNYFAEINANTSTQITFNDSIYGAAARLSFATSDTFELNQVVHGMDMIGRTGGSLVPGTDTPALPSGWNDQTTEPWRQWQNGSGNQATVDFNAVSRTIVGGVHYTNVAPVGYSPYVFPHPLVSGEVPPGGGGGLDLPAAPGVQRIGGLNFKL